MPNENPMIDLDPATTALIVIDMQNDFCHADGYYARAGRDISQLAAATAPVARLLERARAAGLSVVFTRLVHDEARGAMEERHTIRPLRWTAQGKRLTPGTWGADVVDALRPTAGELIIDKHGYSAFDDTTLEQDLHRRGVKTVLLAGVVTYACVLATGFAAFDRGFDVLLVKDAAGSWIDRLGASTSEVVDLLLGRSVAGDELNFSSTQIIVTE
ncbi:cysteine hydrolase [Roseiarcaceae bacterium H3SJ34-1]|uniref:cysteine hydrolase family protein n=1 Tax=Terripilifer ovatus TaxID=3032367 RepID=UPI003AB97C50|nr:cysteine hydrolase [Roseiarcaceae bacterium H3SJ34-1]